MNTPETKIIVNPSIPATMIPVAIRQLLLILGGAVTLSALVGARDWNGLLAYLQSEPFILVLTAGATLWATIQGQRVSLRNTAEKSTMAPYVPDDVAVLKDATPAPAVDQV